jgi:Delta7-sterol 5-desaturase
MPIFSYIYISPSSMISLLFVIFLTFLLTSFLGFIIHWSFHQPWSGRLYKSHYTHHFKLYPPGNLISDIYRDPGDDSTARLFIILFSPLLLVVIGLTIFHIIPIIYGCAIFGTMAIVGVLNDRLHDSAHLNKSMWHRWPGFSKLQKLHNIHHFDVSKNYGIFSFMWDKLFKTYKGD